MSSPLQQAGCWFLRSGIQEAGGGVARYFRTDTNRNAPVSAEITGYAVSALAYLHSATRSGKDSEFLDAARRAARYLANDAWDETSSTFPFEPGSRHAYFFDIGIIVRGLMAAWRATGDVTFRARAREAALSLAFDFMDSDRGDPVFRPVITLPEKQPLEDEPRWSRRPGCYQLKAALAWVEVGVDVGDDIGNDVGNLDDPGILKSNRHGESSAPVFGRRQDRLPRARPLFDAALKYSLATHESFLAEEQDHEKLMDRLHAYCYFLEALLFVPELDTAKRALSGGIERVAGLLREIAPEFERSDVCAQLLRVRLIAHHAGMAALDEDAAREEANRAASYQCGSTDARVDGGYRFGRKGGEMLPFMNPAATAFCMQALAMWEQHRTGAWRFDIRDLI